MARRCPENAGCGTRACRESIKTVPTSGCSSSATKTTRTAPCCDFRDQSISMRSWPYSRRFTSVTMRHRRLCGCRNLRSLCSGHRIVSRAVLAIAVFASSAIPAALAAGSANAQLVVGVTVVRSCVVDAQPASQTASRLKLSCAAGAMRGVQTNQNATRFDERSRSADLIAPTSPVSEIASQRDLRVVTFNF